MTDDDILGMIIMGKKPAQCGLIGLPRGLHCAVPLDFMRLNRADMFWQAPCPSQLAKFSAGGAHAQ